MRHEKHNLKNSTYEDLLEYEVTGMMMLKLEDLRHYRQRIIEWKDNVIHILKKDEDITTAKRSYYIGLEKYVINPLLNKIKKRIKTFNRIAHNGVNKDVLREFITIAMEILPIWQFQQIYGRAVMNADYKTNIEDINEFIEESKNVLRKDDRASRHQPRFSEP